MALALTETPPTPELLLPEASAYVYTLFKEKLPPDILYHTYEHTVEVADAAVRIGKKTPLPKGKLPLIELAAWFHDAGFTETYDGHEEAGVRIANAYLHSRGLPEPQIHAVAALIRATRSGHAPQDAAEEVLHDADLVHTGKKNFFERSERLRREWETYLGRTFSDQGWTELQLDFLNRSPFLTAYAAEKYGGRRLKNLRLIQRRLAATLAAEQAAAAPGPPAEEPVLREAPSRGVETMFRSTYRNHVSLSSMADSKANIMISVNAILMSIIISFVSSRLQTNPWLMVPSATLLITALVAIVYAILSARPKVTNKVFTLEDVRQNRSNILFFGNFVNMDPADFSVGMKELMLDWDRLYDNMISDIYSLGQVLSKKYRLLWISYTVFMTGLALSVILFMILFFV